jgi:hypothetical protein
MAIGRIAAKFPSNLMRINRECANPFPWIRAAAPPDLDDEIERSTRTLIA